MIKRPCPHRVIVSSTHQPDQNEAAMTQLNIGMLQDTLRGEKQDVLVILPAVCVLHRMSFVSGECGTRTVDICRE
jgi:hypothetical protein